MSGRGCERPCGWPLDRASRSANRTRCRAPDPGSSRQRIPAAGLCPGGRVVRDCGGRLPGQCPDLGGLSLHQGLVVSQVDHSGSPAGRSSARHHAPGVKIGPMCECTRLRCSREPLMAVLTRRDALLSTALMAGLSSTSAARAASGSTMSDPAQHDGVTRSATRVRGFADPEMDFQLLRSLGVANYMGAAVGEILAAVREIKDGDARTWPPAFAALGDRTRSVARSALPKHPVSARDHFLRASMYYRAAEYYDDPVTDASRAHGLASRDAFVEAAKLMPAKPEVLQIPFERTWLPGYFMRPADAEARPRKTVILLTGFDGTGEELHFQAGHAALERGWNVLIAEGPGQAGFLRFHPDVAFRPDYERPVGAMIDYALSRG